MNKQLALGMLALALSIPQAQAAEEKILYLFNWADYFAPDTLQQFEKETGIKVKLDVYDSDETLQAKLLAGDSGYDVVWPSNDFMAKQIQAGAYRKLDKSKLPNYKHLDPKLLGVIARSDPGNQYSAPYMWGTMGVGYDKDRITAILGKDMPKNSMELLFNPAIAARIAAKCRMGVQDSASSILPLALRYIGRDPVNPGKQDYAAAQAMLMKIRPYIRRFVVSPTADELVSGELCVTVGFSGAINLAASKAHEMGIKRNIVYDIPSMGSLMWFDGMLIPKNSRHPDNAHAFINFILRPDIIAKISDATRYANANLSSQKLVDRKLSSNPTIYLNEAKKQTLFTQQIQSSENSRIEGRTWLTFKKG
ncbi:extracellular solute-binding protein [Aquitalea sp. S1-19]|nr:extracellular solute-binding protein [Aquitalea sp. S1-19]